MPSVILRSQKNEIILMSGVIKGNLIQSMNPSQTVNYQYNFMNKVASITKTGLENISLTFEYNSEGNRINKTYSDGKTFNYVYDGINVLKEESNIYNAPSFYLSGGIDQLFARTINNNAEFYIKDAINSLRAVTDSSQGITQSIDYKPFGSVLSGDAGNHSYLFTGREKDFNDVYYYRNRTYSTTTGTFHQRDPIGVLGGLNLYSYVRNNPVNYLDPLGLHDDSIDGYYEENFFEPLGDVIQEAAENVENTVNEVSDVFEEGTTIIDNFTEDLSSGISAITGSEGTGQIVAGSAIILMSTTAGIISTIMYPGPDMVDGLALYGIYHGAVTIGGPISWLLLMSRGCVLLNQGVNQLLEDILEKQ